MRIKDMILVSERTDAAEVKCICNLEDYLAQFVFSVTEEERRRAGMIADLIETRAEPNKWSVIPSEKGISSARYCSDMNELKAFMLVKANSQEIPVSFSMYRSSGDCMSAMKNLGISLEGELIDPAALQYEKMEQEYKPGDILHNFNGVDYRVMELLSDKNLLLLDTINHTFVVAVEAECFVRYPKNEGFTSDNCEYGVEWQYGVYLGNVLSEIDFKALRQDYGKAKDEVTARREELNREFEELCRISDNQKFPLPVREAAKDALYDTFGTSRKSIFTRKLEAGKFDRGNPARAEYSMAR